jgi:hypothetical protein
MSLGLAFLFGLSMLVAAISFSALSEDPVLLNIAIRMPQALCASGKMRGLAAVMSRSEFCKQGS